MRKLEIFSYLIHNKQWIRFPDSVPFSFGSGWKMLLTRIHKGRLGHAAHHMEGPIKGFCVQGKCMGLLEKTRVIVAHRRHQKVIQKIGVSSKTCFIMLLMPSVHPESVRINCHWSPGLLQLQFGLLYGMTKSKWSPEGHFGLKIVVNSCFRVPQLRWTAILGVAMCSEGKEL